MESRLWHRKYAKGVSPSIRFIDIPLSEALSRTAAGFPNRHALEFQGASMTFEELEGNVRKFAGALKELGIEPGDKVAVALPNIIQTVIAIYACLRVGAVVVDLNPRNDDMKFEQQLKASGARTVICLDVLAPRIQAIKARAGVETIVSCHIRDYLPFLKKQLFPLVKKHLHLDTADSGDVLEFTDLLKRGAPLVKPHNPNMDDTAFILFTSATTGKSKGVELSHSNVVRNVQQLRSWFPGFRDGEEIVVACLPFFHVFGLTCALNIGVFCGFTNVLVPAPEPKSILDAIADYKATFIPALPSFYTGMIDFPGLKKYDLTSLKGCFSGGAPMARESMKTFEDLTGAMICEGYGLTESGPVTHVNPHGGDTRVGTIGLPLPETDARIVDVDDFSRTITTPGEPGELCVKGPQVMKGYLNLPEQTAETLRDGWLLTGDIAAIDEDGYFKIIDRKKDLILAQGNKIYPRDIDEVLFRHPKILEACALGVPDNKGEESIKAYVVLRKGETAHPSEIINFCRKHLPTGQTPRSVVFIDELPKSAVGKILRKQLRRMHLIDQYGRAHPEVRSAIQE